jgi:hypothetical protein
MRLALLLALLCCWAISPTARACERPAANGDVFLDVRGDELRILIVNVSDACMIRFIDVYEIDYERPLRDVPWMLYWKVSDLRGRMLSRTDYLSSGWYGYGSSGRLIYSDSAPLTRPPTVLRPGESRLVRVSLHAMMQHVSGVLLMEKKPDLPWGRAVQIELQFHAFDRPAARGPTANVVDVTSNAFVYKLRDAPY